MPQVTWWKINAKDARRPLLRWPRRRKQDAESPLRISVLDSRPSGVHATPSLITGVAPKKRLHPNCKPEVEVTEFRRDYSARPELEAPTGDGENSSNSH